MDARTLDLESFTELAKEFARDLNDTVRSVAGPECSKFDATITTADRGSPSRLGAFIRQDDASGIRLTSGGETVLIMQVNIRVIPDGRMKYLRVKKSQFRVYPPEGSEASQHPVFRYEYDHRQESMSMAAAHFQVHGSHPALEAMIAAGRKGRGMPDISKLHFPLGGTRFRPCLEDVLEMLIREFGIDPVPDMDTALEALRRGREQWREKQLMTLVRDDLKLARGVLEREGYKVVWPHDDTPEPERNPRTFERL